MDEAGLQRKYKLVSSVEPLRGFWQRASGSGNFWALFLVIEKSPAGSTLFTKTIAEYGRSLTALEPNTTRPSRAAVNRYSRDIWRRWSVRMRLRYRL
jgi:hypothetical protein